MSKACFTPAQVTLHWISAAVILWALGSGFLLAAVELQAGVAAWISAFNVSLTALLAPLFAVRILLAWRHRHQRVHAHGVMGALARHAHRGLYVVTVLVLATGILMMDRDIRIFGLLQLPAPVTDPYLLQLYHTIHRYACVVLAMMVFLHIGAVVMHHWRRTPVLQRMWY